MDIIHDENEGKFYVNEAGTWCGICYKKLNDKLWDFFNTMPESANVAQLQEEIISYALKFVRENKIKIKASCSSVQDYLVRHKEMKDVIYHPY